MESIIKKIQIAKKRLLKMHFDKKIGHIGGNLSSLDAMMVLYNNIMVDEDTFILSKGHSAGALYIALWSIGKLSDSDLDTFHGDNTNLAGHPTAGWCQQIPISTGSLGHGLPVAIGNALGNKLLNKPGHTYCLTSDGEWQEGSMWEALIFLAHHKLSNLTVLVDLNGLQGFGTTDEIASMSDLRNKISAFNLNVVEVDGHNPLMLQSTLEQNKGSIIILNTTKGNGISFMENKMEWHYLPLTDDQFKLAISEVGEPNEK